MVGGWLAKQVSPEAAEKIDGAENIPSGGFIEHSSGRWRMFVDQQARFLDFVRQSTGIDYNKTRAALARYPVDALQFGRRICNYGSSRSKTFSAGPASSRNAGVSASLSCHVMSEDYGQSAPLSYNKYLRVPELIDLQTCLSSPAHHDELLFITVHQAYELWFKQILHEIDAAIVLMKEDRSIEAAQALRRVVEIEKLLIAQIHILETMSPVRFLGFRDELNPASGFQSMQFREIEFSSGLKDEKSSASFAHDDFARRRLEARMQQPSLSDAFFALLRRSGFDTPASDAPRDTEERRSNYGKRQRAVVEILTASREQLQQGVPVSRERCSSTTNIFRSGVHITSKWLSAWWGPNQAPAVRRCRLPAKDTRQEILSGALGSANVSRHQAR